MAEEYSGRHRREDRHEAWAGHPRYARRPRTQLLTAIATLTVSGFLVGGASAAIALSPTAAPATPPPVVTVVTVTD